MKIAHIVDYFHPEMGYQENHISKIQAKDGHEVLIITGDRFTVWGNNKTDEFKRTIISGDAHLLSIGVKVHRLSVQFEYSHRIWPNGIWKVLNEFKPDIVHVHGYFTLNAIVCSFLKKKNKFRLIVDDHMLYQGGTNKFAAIVNPIFKHVFSRYIQNKSDKIIAVSNETKDYMVEIYGLDEKRIETIPLGVELEIFKPVAESSKNSLIEKLNVKNKKIVLYTGKINADKDPLKAIMALLPLWKKGWDFVMLTVGNKDQDYHEKILAYLKLNNIEDKVIFHPPVKTEELALFFNIATLAVWPCQSSMSALEAMACACPVILSDSPVNRERISGGGGLVYNSKDLNDLSEKILKVLEDEAFKINMGEKGVAYTKSLDWIAINKKILE